MPINTDDAMIEEGYKIAKKITSSSAKTFYLCSLFLDKKRRNASLSIYAVCRISDNAVDDASETEKMTLNIKKIRNDIETAYDQTALNDPLLIAFKKSVSDFSIPKTYFDDLLKGMELDIEKKRYKNFAELYDYCYKVAGVVGLMMLKILGSRIPKSENHAIELGIAMQLTNILRDVKEDFARGRIYFPEDELKHYRISEEDFTKEKTNPRIKEFLKFQAARAKEYYQHSQEGIAMIGNTRSRFVANIMKEMYAAILDEIEKNGYNVFEKRAYVPFLKKILIIAKNILGSLWR